MNRNYFERVRTTSYRCRCGGDMHPSKYWYECDTCGKIVVGCVEGLPTGSPFC